MNYSSVGDATDRYNSRPLSEMEQKVRGSIKGVIQYEDGPNYREHVRFFMCWDIKVIRY